MHPLQLYATEATSKYLTAHNIPATTVGWPVVDLHEKSDATSATK